jgi:hypothetical protein
VEAPSEVGGEASALQRSGNAGVEQEKAEWAPSELVQEAESGAQEGK